MRRCGGAAICTICTEEAAKRQGAEVLRVAHPVPVCVSRTCRDVMLWMMFVVHSRGQLWIVLRVVLWSVRVTVCTMVLVESVEQWNIV